MPRRAWLLPLGFALAGSVVIAACAAGIDSNSPGTTGAGGDTSTDAAVVAASSGSKGSASVAPSAAMSSSSTGLPTTCTTKADCAGLDGPCNTGNCVNSMCTPSPANEGAACDDGMFCTDNDVCQTGTCVGGTPKFCPSPDSCHVGACDEGTKACGSAPGNDGASCDDGDPCTYSGTCSAGACSKGPPVDCSNFNSVCGDGVCDPVLGCQAKPKNDGSVCDDGLFCTVNDVCKAGACSGAPNTCAPPGDICMVGSCDEPSQSCVAVPGNDGSACSDGNPCHIGAKCSAGTCTGGVPGNQGMMCDDGNGCTSGTTCSNGVCGAPVSQISSCINGDTCCPAACNFGNDSDCGFQFKVSQVIDGQTVTCSSVVNNAMYTECDDLKEAGEYFPNGIECGPVWSNVNAGTSDTVGFCKSLTGNPMIDVYYTCDSTMPRTTWHAHAWGTTMDNGYTQHVRCYH